MFARKLHFEINKLTHHTRHIRTHAEIKIHTLYFDGNNKTFVKSIVPNQKTEKNLYVSFFVGKLIFRLYAVGSIQIAWKVYRKQKIHFVNK